jgi:hypothetical protein
VTALQKGISRRETLCRRCCIDENTKLRREEVLRYKDSKYTVGTLR